ncbi:MAG: hypothetical protein ACHP9Y_04930, partial [Gammaproteobacteria bacterium]
GIFSVAIILDVINTVHEQTLKIAAIEADIIKAVAINNEQLVAELQRKKLILECYRISTIGFGILALTGGLCVVSSNALALVGGSAELIAQLGFYGSYLLAGAAIFFAVFRLCADQIGYTIEYKALTKQINTLLLSPSTPQNTMQIQALQLRQRENIHERAKSFCYYFGLVLVLGVSLAAGPVAGIIAFCVFFAIQQLYKHVIAPRIVEPLIKNYPLPKAVAPTPTPAPGFFSRILGKGVPTPPPSLSPSLSTT